MIQCWLVQRHRSSSKIHPLQGQCMLNTLDYSNPPCNGKTHILCDQCMLHFSLLSLSSKDQSLTHIHPAFPQIHHICKKQCTEYHNHTWINLESAKVCRAHPLRKKATLYINPFRSFDIPASLIFHNIFSRMIHQFDLS